MVHSWLDEMKTMVLDSILVSPNLRCTLGDIGECQNDDTASFVASFLVVAVVAVFVLL